MFEILLEVGGGLVVVAGCYYAAITRPNGAFPAKWLGFVICTVVLFGYPVYWRRGDLSNKRFWFRWIGLLLAHVCVLGLLLISVHQWPLILFAGTTLLEFILITPLLQTAK